MHSSDELAAFRVLALGQGLAVALLNIDALVNALRLRRERLLIQLLTTAFYRLGRVHQLICHQSPNR